MATGADANITGAGSTFVYPVLAKWASDFKAAGGDEINYQSIGSGGGIAQIKAGTVDFGATDKPLSSEELEASGLAQFPVVIGGIVPVINIPGARPGQVKMSGSVLADIYAGTIKTWNDPRIARIDPGLHFPAKPITAVHRADDWVQPSTSPITSARSAPAGSPSSAKAKVCLGMGASAARATRASRAT